uniref:Uncharacterized protein n=1 Tax=Arundo donax TaxID=35708 RepID=A0A0A9DXF7_ARUDO
MISKNTRKTRHNIWKEKAMGVHNVFYLAPTPQHATHPHSNTLTSSGSTLSLLNCQFTWQKRTVLCLHLVLNLHTILNKLACHHLPESRYYCICTFATS